MELGRAWPRRSDFSRLEPLAEGAGSVTPLCLHREEFVCERCLKCGKCCDCMPAPSLVHRNSRSASERYRAMLRNTEHA